MVVVRHQALTRVGPRHCCMKTLCGWAVGLAHVPQSGLPDLIRPARTDTPSAPRASTRTDARTAGPAPAPLAPSTSPGERGGLPRRRVPGPSRAVCTLETGRYRPGRTASRHGPSEPRSSPARARGRLRRPCQWQPKTAHFWQLKTAHVGERAVGRSGRSPVDAHRACWAGRRERSDRSPGQHAPRRCGAGGHDVTPSRRSSDAVRSQC